MLNLLFDLKVTIAGSGTLSITSSSKSTGSLIPSNWYTVSV